MKGVNMLLLSIALLAFIPKSLSLALDWTLDWTLKSTNTSVINTSSSANSTSTSSSANSTSTSSSAISTNSSVINISSSANSTSSSAISTNSSANSTSSSAISTNTSTTSYSSIAAFSAPDCSDGVIANQLSDPALRWSKSNASAVLTNLFNMWPNFDLSYSSSISASSVFIDYILQFFNYTGDSWDCANAAAGVPCSSTIACNQVNAPAGYLIINSFVNIHNIYATLLEALVAAGLNVQADIGNFASIFSPQVPDDSLFVKGLLRFLNAIITVATAVTFNMFLASVSRIVGLIGTQKDTVNAFITFGIGVGRDQLTPKFNALNTQNSVSGYLALIDTLWESVIGDILNTTFSGSTEGLNLLYDLTNNGLMLGSPPSVTDLIPEVTKTLYAFLIPEAWAICPQNPYPIILKTPLTCSNDTSAPLLDPPFLTGDIGLDTYACVDNQFFFLVNAAGSGASYINLPFSELPGGTHDNLNQNGWGNVSITDLVISSYRGYQQNGNKNGNQISDNLTAISELGNDGKLIFEDRIQTPGLFNITVCELNANDCLDIYFGNIAGYITCDGFTVYLAFPGFGEQPTTQQPCQYPANQ